MKNVVRELGTQLKLRRRLRNQIRGLSPWYQPIDFGNRVRATAVDKKGTRHTSASLDRGIAKWNKFVKPNLPLDLADKRVLELGCNAGLFLVECIREGAREAVGIEKDDHYYGQARFVAESFSQLHKRYYAVRVFQGSMEDFDYESLGRFDLALLMNVIYHIGASADDSGVSHEAIASVQAETLRRVARVAKYMMFQANPLHDVGRGSGKHSLLELVRRADLTVVNEAVYDHPRGYILVTRSAVDDAIETFPLSRMVSKYFLPPHLNAEREVVDLYAKYGRSGFDITETRYHQLRTAKLDWNSPGVAHLPASLDRDPVYWVVPWSCKPRRRKLDDSKAKAKVFPEVYARFLGLIDSILEGGVDPKGAPIPGYRLVHPEHGDVFIYVDGNQRMGALSYLAAQTPGKDVEVPVEVRQVIERDRLLSYPLTRQLIEEGHFTERDAVKWFDNAFWFATGDARED